MILTATKDTDAVHWSKMFDDWTTTERMRKDGGFHDKVRPTDDFTAFMDDVPWNSSVADLHEYIVDANNAMRNAKACVTGIVAVLGLCKC